MGVMLLSSCDSDRDYSEAEVLAAARILIQKSELLNEIYHGKGIEYDLLDSAYSSGSYRKALDSSLDRFGIETVDDLKKMTKEVYTKGYSNDIFGSKLETIYDSGGEIISLARYVQKYDVMNEPMCILVNTQNSVLLLDKVIYHYENLKVVGVEGERIFVSLSATVMTADEKTQERTLRVVLIEEEKGWRLDGPTYLSYNENLSKYEELENKLNK